MEKNLSESVRRISGVNVRKCMKCGKCSASCPAYDDMDFHPHQFISMVDAGNITPLLESSSIWNCLSCFACVQRCPRGVEPSKVIEAVRVLRIRRQGENHMKPDVIPEKLNEDLPQQAIVSAMRKYNK